MRRDDCAVRALALSLTLLAGAACSSRRPPSTPDLPPGGRAQSGLASWYGVEEAGRATASGEPMDPERLTAAHKTLPFGSLVRVTLTETGRSVDVIINDRGPFVRGRVIDLSFAAARAIGMVELGVAPVRLEVLGLEGPLAERRWRVQLGSFTDRRAADDLRLRVQSEGFSPVVISPFEQNGRSYHRVWAGEYRERDGAESFRRQLRRAGYEGFVPSRRRRVALRLDAAFAAERLDRALPTLRADRPAHELAVRDEQQVHASSPLYGDLGREPLLGLLRHPRPHPIQAVRDPVGRACRPRWCPRRSSARARGSRTWARYPAAP